MQPRSVNCRSYKDCTNRLIDISIQEQRQRLIDIFVNSVYLYDGYAVITFNYKDGTKTITLDEVEGTDDGSYLSAFGVPNPEYFYDTRSFSIFDLFFVKIMIQFMYINQTV